MGLVEDFKNRKVFLDTAPLIYYIEGHSDHQRNLQQLFLSNEKKEFQFITSTLTLLEVMVHPLKMGRQELADQYERILTSSKTIDIFEMNVQIAKRAAQLRAKYNLKTPDSIQMATALENEASFFLTNDFGLKRVNELRVITLGE